VTPVTAALMHRTVTYFITFTLKCFALSVLHSRMLNNDDYDRCML